MYIIHICIHTYIYIYIYIYICVYIPVGPLLGPGEARADPSDPRGPGPWFQAFVGMHRDCVMYCLCSCRNSVCHEIPLDPALSNMTCWGLCRAAGPLGAGGARARVALFQSLAECGFKTRRDCLAQQNLSWASIYWYTRESQRRTASSSSRSPTVLFQQYSANQPLAFSCPRRPLAGALLARAVKTAGGAASWRGGPAPSILICP